MSELKFVLPDVGEGLTEAEIVSWKVAPGDEITINQVLVEIETAKSLVELPSPFAGMVQELLVSEGQTVAVGSPIIVVAGGEDSKALDLPGVSATGNANDVGKNSSAVLVGYGNAEPAVSRRQRSRAEPENASLVIRSSRGNFFPGGETPGEKGCANNSSESSRASESSVKKAESQSESLPSKFVMAKPPIRKLAKDLGVNLMTVKPTGVHGDVTRDDVVREASQASVFRNIETPEWPAIREDRIPVKGVRKAIAQAMVNSAFTAPHVSVFVDVDATRTMEYVKRLKNSTDFADVKVSPLLIMAKAMIWAIRRNATVNSTWTDEEIIVHHFVNLGVAAATPRGLIVPNVKETQAMSLRELAVGLERLTIAAREGKTSPADMKDGTITVTNIGVFGMDTGTPILNPGEVAIVALGAIKQKPWVVDGEVRPRFVTTIGASFDHRVVDGDVASRFVADVASIIEEPALLLE